MDYPFYLKFWVGGKINRLGQLAPHPCQYTTQLNVWSKHLRLTEKKEVNILSTKYSCSKWCNKISLLSILSEILAGGHYKPPGQLAPPPPPTPCQYVTQLNVWSKQLRLTEIKFISLSTKYSCSRWCNKNCWLSILSEILGGKQDKPPWTACPPPPCQYVTQLNVWSKHLRLTEIKVYIPFN